MVEEKEGRRSGTFFHLSSISNPVEHENDVILRFTITFIPY